jgi:hypothetical protein
MNLPSLNQVVRRGFGHALLALAVLALASCGGGGGSPGVTSGSSSGSTTALFVTAPVQVTLPVNTSQTYTIGGGTGSYTASSSDTAVGKVAVTAGANTLTVSSLVDGVAQISVFDSSGKSITFSLTVGSGGTATTFFFTAPKAVTIGLNSTQTFAISGGTAPYSTSSSVSGVASASVTGTTLSITALKDGKSDISVFDAKGATLSTTVTAGNGGVPQALFINAPPDITIGVGTTTAQYTISGGSAPYSASSSNTSVAGVKFSGSQLTINGVAAGTALIGIFDSTGKSVSTNINVGNGAVAPALYVTAPSAITLAAGGASSYVIGGGTGPYIASSSNTNIATTAITAGSTLTINGIAEGTSTVNVFDTTGKSVTITVTVGSGGIATLYVTAPGAIAIGPGEAPAFAIGGGSGPYTASSSNTGVVTVSVVKTVLTIRGVSPGAAQVAVFDAAGKTVAVNVTVGSNVVANALFITAPNAVSIANGSSASYTFSGGTGPYVATSSNTAIAAASISGSTLTVFGKAVGVAQVAVFDGTGKSVSVNVTVPSGSAAANLFTTSPAKVTLSAGSAASYQVGGGTAPYTASSSNVAVATATLNGSALTITGSAAGAAEVVVVDAAGVAVTISVTVPAVNGAVLFTSSPAAITIASGAGASYQVSGGTAPYIATSSNTVVAQTSVSGTTLTINGMSAGAAQVVVQDAKGAVVNIAVTVSSVTNSQLSALPAAATANVGDVLSFQVAGGAPPYAVTLNNGSIASLASSVVATNGGTFKATLLNVGTTSISIVDSVGAVTTITLTVNQTSTVMRLSPSAMLVGENNGNPITLFIYGGNAPYSAFTSDLLKSSVSLSGTTANPSITVSTGTSGNRCINPVDGTGAYIRNGTYAITITVVDSLGASATSVMTIMDNGAGLGAGCP